MVDVTRCPHQVVDALPGATGSLSCRFCATSLPGNWECVECDWRGRVLSAAEGVEIHAVVLEHSCSRHACSPYA